MNVSDIWTEVSRDLGTSVPLPELVSLINRALDDLTPVAKKEIKKTTDIVDSNSYELPADLHHLRNVVVNGDVYRLINIGGTCGYQLWGDEITLIGGPTSGTVEIYYEKQLAHVDAQDDVPEIEPEYHNLFVLYAKSQLIRDDSAKRQEVAMQYEQRKREYRGRQKRRNFMPMTNVYGGF
jgi:hypothetical protein